MRMKREERKNVEVKAIREQNKIKEKLLPIIIVIGLIIVCVSVNYNISADKVIKKSMWKDFKFIQISLNEIEKGIDDCQNYEDLQELFQEDRNYLIMSCLNTKNYKKLNKKYEYLDINKLDIYLQAVLGEELDDKEFSYHKKNIKKISSLWNKECLSIDIEQVFLKDDYFRKMLEETKILAEEGYNQLND